MPKWKYKEADVTVGENTQRVRQLTADERRQFAENAKKRKEEGKTSEASGASEMMQKLVEWASMPPLSKDDVASMPAELLDACTSKILDLSGLGDKGDEKKD